MLAGRAPVVVEIDEVPDERLPEPVEAAAYYLVAEALTNVAKYARADQAHIRIAHRNELVGVVVADDGIGGPDATHGTGLRGLADRIEALRGHLEVRSVSGEGTSVRATIPVPIRP
jgi:signal transduction histidine kinase